jgi:hypothetical protein
VIPVAHIAGIPVEETVAMYVPVLTLAGGAAVTMVRARVRRLRRQQKEDS